MFFRELIVQVCLLFPKAAAQVALALGKKKQRTKGSQERQIKRNKTGGKKGNSDIGLHRFR